MKLARESISLGLALLLAALWSVPAHAAAVDKRKARTKTSTHAQSSAGTKPSAAASARPTVTGKSAPTTVRSTRRRLASRRLSSRRRRAQLRIQPERIEEIQRALTQAGYLHEQPSGRWDDQTRSAMQRYQVDQGFPVTGLPEAKSLMKLGLGPHPLPPEVDPSVSAHASSPPVSSANPASDQANPPPSEPQN